MSPLPAPQEPHTWHCSIMKIAAVRERWSPLAVCVTLCISPVLLVTRSSRRRKNGKTERSEGKGQTVTREKDWKDEKKKDGEEHYGEVGGGFWKYQSKAKGKRGKGLAERMEHTVAPLPPISQSSWWSRTNSLRLPGLSSTTVHRVQRKEKQKLVGFRSLEKKWAGIWLIPLWSKPPAHTEAFRWGHLSITYRKTDLVAYGDGCFINIIPCFSQHSLRCVALQFSCNNK